MSNDEKVLEMDDADKEWPVQMKGEGGLKSQHKRKLMNSTGDQTDYITQLKRFLCIGTTGGTYYAGEVELIKENARCIDRLINSKKGKDVVELVREFNVKNRACKQGPIIYTLALCCRSNDPTTKVEGYKILSDVCRIPTHLFEFIKHCKEESAGAGWGRAHRRAISNWYFNYGKKGEAENLARLMTKYKNRFGWSHKDIFRLCHIKPDPEHPEINYLIMVTTAGKKKTEIDFKEVHDNPELEKVRTFMDAVARAERCRDVEIMKRLILDHNLTREHVPTDLLKSKEVWKALIRHLPMTAMIRNLGKMSHLELLEPGTFEETLTIQKLTNPELLKHGRIHPFTLLVALNQYKKSHGELGKMKWKKNVNIEKALEDAFYLSFKNVEPTGKRFCLAVDVSGSMNVPVMGTPTISVRDAAAAMIMVTARTEENYEVVAFSDKLTPLDIKSSDNLHNVLDKCTSLPVGNTDFSMPMLYAMEQNKEFDIFIVYTDSETYFEKGDTSKTLVKYQQITHARLIVCRMASNKFTIADPNDPMMMDIVGFDTNAPQAINEFVMGHI